MASKGEEDRLEGVSARMCALTAVMGAIACATARGRCAEPAAPQCGDAADRTEVQG